MLSPSIFNVFIVTQAPKGNHPCTGRVSNICSAVLSPNPLCREKFSYFPTISLPAPLSRGRFSLIYMLSLLIRLCNAFKSCHRPASGRELLHKNKNLSANVNFAESFRIKFAPSLRAEESREESMIISATFSSRSGLPVHRI